MPEFESLASDEPLDHHVARHRLDRIIMLSDGVFAIAMTLAAIEVHLPENSTSLLQLIHDSGRSIGTYLLSFLLTTIFWLQHRDLFARLRSIDTPLTAMTLGMLCMIALIPATIHIVYAPGGTDVPYRFYALTMFVCGLLLFGMWLYATLKPGMVKPGVPRSYLIGRVVGAGAMPVIFAPNVLMPVEDTPIFVLPTALALAIFRRVILPRWAKREAAKIAS